MRLIILYFVVVITILNVECDDSQYVPRTKSKNINYEIMPDQISYDVEVFFADSSFTKAVLKAKRARIYQKRMETLLDGGIKVEFLSRYTGKRVSILTADSARIDDKTKNMLSGGHVIVVSDSSGTKLETSRLEWLNETQKLYSTEFVKIISSNEIIQGYGFESDQNLSNYKIFRVSGEQRQK